MFTCLRHLHLHHLIPTCNVFSHRCNQPSGECTSGVSHRIKVTPRTEWRFFPLTPVRCALDKDPYVVPRTTVDVVGSTYTRPVPATSSSLTSSSIEMVNIDMIESLILHHHIRCGCATHEDKSRASAPVAIGAFLDTSSKLLASCSSSHLCDSLNTLGSL